MCITEEIGIKCFQNSKGISLSKSFLRKKKEKRKKKTLYSTKAESTRWDHFYESCQRVFQWIMNWILMNPNDSLSLKCLNHINLQDVFIFNFIAIMDGCLCWLWFGCILMRNEWKSIYFKWSPCHIYHFC